MNGSAVSNGELVEVTEALLKHSVDELYIYNKNKDQKALKNAIEDAREMCAMRPIWVRGLVQLALCLEKVGTTESAKEALSCFQKAATVDNSINIDNKKHIMELEFLLAASSCVTVLEAPELSTIYDIVTIDCCSSEFGTLIVGALKTGDVCVWSTMKKRLLSTFKAHSDSVTTLSLSKNRNMLATGSLDNTAKIWSVDEIIQIINRQDSVGSVELKHKIELKGHTNRVNSLLFTPDDEALITGSTDGTVLVWSASDGHCKFKLQGHSSMVSSICVSPCGKTLVSASGDTCFRLWSLENGRCMQDVGWDSGPVVLCSFYSDIEQGSYLLTAHAQLMQQEARILIWDAVNQTSGWLDGRLAAPVAAIDDLKGKPTCLDCVCYYDEEVEREVPLIAASCSDGTIHIWDVSDGPLKLMALSLEEVTADSGTRDLPPWRASSIKHSQNAHNMLSFSPSGKQIAASSSENMKIKIWDIETGQEQQCFLFHSMPIRKLVWMTEHELLSASEDGRICHWRI